VKTLALLFSASWLGSGWCQTFETLHYLTGADGAEPNGPLVRGSDGCLYGATSSGGVWGQGTIFKLTPTGQFVSVASFNGTNGSGPSGVTFGADGNLYGTSQGSNTTWNVFRASTSGAITVLGSYNETMGAAFPELLVQAPDGVFYGTTQQGGAYDYGVAFSVTTNGLIRVLATFDGTNGAFPGFDPAALVLRQGILYGTTYEGGSNWCGTAFSLTTNGVLTTLACFGGPQGIGPRGTLLLANDGSFYGVADNHESSASIFRMTPEGVISTLCTLSGPLGGESNPSGLIQARDGYLYGSIILLGSNGAVYRFSGGEALDIVFQFSNTNGSDPWQLVQGADGNLYGATSLGGVDYGTVFALTFPQLNSTETSNQIVLSWPTNQTGFTLQSSASLISPAWLNCDIAPAIVGDLFVVTNPISAPADFFRLMRQ